MQFDLEHAEVTSLAMAQHAAILHVLCSTSCSSEWTCKGVQEVIRSLEMTQVPLAPEVVSGLINLRGQIVTAVDLRRRLELEPAPEGQLSDECGGSQRRRRG